MNIALADDDQNLLAMLVPHLEHAGHTVMLASSGAELMSKLKETRADLIISDINMPGLDGIGIYMQARSLNEYAAVPVILCSGLEVEQGKALAAGDAKLRFLKKPFSLAALHRAIDEVTDLPLFGDYEPRSGLKP